MNSICYAITQWIWKFKVIQRSTGKAEEIHRWKDSETQRQIAELLFGFYKASQSFISKIVFYKV